MAIRLDKFLAEMGAGSRTDVKKIIKSGQITVNGQTVLRPEEKIDAEKDIVNLQGETVNYQKFAYYMFYKPAGCVSATEDSIHKTVIDYFTDTARTDLFPVGRLDLDTEGLLLITNDGALAHKLLSPKNLVPKTYYAEINGMVTESDVNHFREGVNIGEEKLTKPAFLKILKSGGHSEVELTITEGKYHQVKRMFEAVNKEVIYLKRLSMGPLTLDGGLAPGKYRTLTPEELAALSGLPQSKKTERIPYGQRIFTNQ